jgi:two-component sensor histidine kinase
MSYTELSPITSPRQAEQLILVEEISHRVINEYCQAIAGLHRAAAKIVSREARDALTVAAVRLRCFADAHRALQSPDPAAESDLGEYLERLCAAVTVANLNDRGVRLTLVARTVRLDAERCWRVALIVSELITNAVRHGLRGEAGAIVVEVGLDGDDVFCRVIDNGRPDPNPRPSRGHAVVTGLATELGGEARWQFTPHGVLAELTFPLRRHPTIA